MQTRAHTGGKDAGEGHSGISWIGIRLEDGP